MCFFAFICLSIYIWVCCVNIIKINSLLLAASWKLVYTVDGGIYHLGGINQKLKSKNHHNSSPHILAISHLWLAPCAWFLAVCTLNKILMKLRIAVALTQATGQEVANSLQSQPHPSAASAALNSVCLAHSILGATAPHGAPLYITKQCYF